MATPETNLLPRLKAAFLKHPLLYIFLLALLARTAAALALGNEVSGLSGADDEITYNMLAYRLITGHGLTFPDNWYPWIRANEPQSYFSIAMSLYLAAIYTVFGYFPVVARLVTGVMGAGVVALIYLLARRLFGERAAILAGLIASAYTYLVFYSVALVTETPFIFCILLALLLTFRLKDHPSLGNWLLLGACLAGTILTRMAVIFLVPFLLGWLALNMKEKRAYAWIPVLFIAAALTPFIIRNYILWDRFMLLESQFGHVFWNGNHPGHLGNFHPFKVFPIPDEVVASHNDAQITADLLRMGIQNVLSNPLDFLSLTVTRLREFFTFWPTTDSTLLANLMRVISFGVTWPFMAAGLYLSRRNWRSLLPIYLFIIIHTGIYAVSWTMIRYRIPLDAVLIPFAAMALLALYDRAAAAVTARRLSASAQAR